MMRGDQWGRIVAAAAVSVIAAMMGGSGAYAVSPPDSPTNVTITTQFADHDCAGDTDTLSWTAPSNDGGSPITGYRIEQYGDAFNPPQIRSYDVGPDVTSLAVSPFVGDNAVL